MTKKLIMVVVTVAAAFGAWAETWTDPDTGYTWTYRINGDTAEIFNNYSDAISPKPTGAVTIPATLGGKPVTSIGDSAFSGCSGLTSVKIPNSVASIGSSAFYGCNASLFNTTTISGVMLVNGWAVGNTGSLSGNLNLTGIRGIGGGAFSYCRGLNSVTIPDSVTSIGEDAFYGCSGLTSVTIPDSVTSIGEDAFYGCNASLFDTTTIPGVRLVDGWAVGNTGSLSGNLNLTGVRGIGEDAFSGCSGLTSVTIPDSVTSIGEDAFYGCSGLTSVTIPDSVTSIGEDAFYGCSGLTSVTIPDSVKSIWSEVFKDYTGQVSVHITDLEKWCGISFVGSSANSLDLYLNGKKVTDLVIPDGVTSIAGSAFPRCSGLTSVTIPDSVTSIGERAFVGCKGLTSVTIPDSVTSIEPYAFGGCSGLTSVTIGNGVTSIGDSAFIYCGGLTSVMIGNGVRSIEQLAFYSCSGLTSVTIPDSVSSIGDCAFSDCRRLTSVTIGNSVASIGDYAFGGCSGLESVTIPQYVCSSYRRMSSVFPSAYQSITNVVISGGVTSIGHSAFSGCSGLIGVTIPDSVTSISEYAFYGCNASLFDTTTIPGVRLVDGWAVGNTGSLSGNLNLTGVRGIGEDAFSGCSGLTSVTIPDSVTSIGEDAFYGCSGLTSVTIPDSVTSIGDYAFYGCGGLTSVTIPDSLTKRWSEVFKDYTGQVSVHITDLEKWCGISFVGSSANSLDLYLNGKKVTDLVIPDGVTSIAGSAFRRCSGLTSVTIPDSVMSIGSSAFSGCSGLASVTIGNGVTSIESSAFSGCSGLTSVTIPATVEYIWGEAFYGCDGLRRIIFQGDAPTLGNNVFPNLSTGADCVVYIPKDAIGYYTDTSGRWLGMSVVLYDSRLNVVTFDANGGEVSPGTKKVPNGATVGVLPVPTRLGHSFDGWYTTVRGGRKVSDETKITADVTYFAHWTKTGDSVDVVVDPNCAYDIAISFSAGGGTGAMATITKTADICNESTYYKLPACAFRRTGYAFAGWRVKDACIAYADDSSIPVYAAGYSYGPLCGNLNLTATWKVQTPSPGPSPSSEYNLYDDVYGVAPLVAASEYDGYLYDKKSGAVKGSIQIKVGKLNARTGLAAVKAKVQIGATKKSLKGADKGKAAIAEDGPTSIRLVGGEACEVTLGAEGLSGTYGPYLIDGARNFFSSKDKSEVGVANDLLAKWLGPVNVAWDGGSASVSIAKKGKVRVAVTLADGTKATANGQLLVGDEWLCVPVVVTKKTNLAFTLWLPHSGGAAVVEGLPDDVVAGKPGSLKAGAKFHIDAEEFSARWGQRALPYLPDGVPVSQNGTKWMLPKAGKVAYQRGGTDVDSAKLGENPSALKLTYKAKVGSFKGSFKVYADNGGRLKATTVNVSGVVVEGVGYGTAKVKNAGAVPVGIE